VKTSAIAAFGLLIALLGFALWVRFSPDDPARWHSDVAGPSTPTPGPCLDRIEVQRDGARLTCLVADTPAQILSRLDAIALDSPRTRHIAGSAESGRITWQTRSALWGFPDHTTAQAVETPQGTRVDIFARLRFGGSDLGVNAARLRLWLSAL
jgi:hypothetical protein